MKIVLAALLATTPLAAGTATAQQAPAPVTAKPIAVPPLAAVKRTLANGMTVYAHRDPKAASVSVYVWYRTGQRDDPKGRGGFAHLFEHLMFKPTRNLPQGVSAFQSSFAESANATTLFDTTLYTTTAAANRLESLLWMEGERLRNLIVDEKQYASEREVVKEELRQRIFAQPYGRILHHLIPGFVFTTHPYGRPIGGTAEELDRATFAEVSAFHEAFYRPDNMVVVVAGNFDSGQLDAWTDRYLGAIPKPAAPLIVTPPAKEPERTAPRIVDAYAPNVPLPAIVTAWVAPPAADPDSFGIDMVDALLTRGAGGRLNRVLVSEKGLASSNAAFNFPTRDGHAYAITTTLAKDASVAAAEAALASELAALRDRPVSAEELEAAKSALLGEALSARETTQGRAILIGDGATLADDPGLADKRLAAIRNMTPADVQRVAGRWLADRRRVTIRYQDESLRPAGYTGDVSPNAVETMGVVVPPATRPPLKFAGEAEREQPPGPGPQRRQPPAITESKLANGLRIVSARSTDLPLVTLELVLPGGDAGDPAGHAGRADLAAALMLRGAGGRDAAAFGAALDRLGARMSATATPDATILQMTVPAANAGEATRLMADVVLRPGSATAELERERRRLVDAIAVSERRPIQLAVRLLPAAVAAGTPYGSVATAASLAAVDGDDVAAARATWGPRTGTLVITGALDPRAATALAQAAFGAWQGGAAPELPPIPDPRPRIVAIDLPGVAQTAVVAGLPVGPRTAGDHRALQVANAVLGGGSGGWLGKEIREKRGLSYGAGSQIEMRRGAGYVMAATQTKTESAAEVVDLVLAQFTRLAAAPPDPAAVAERSDYVARGLATRTDRTASLGDYLADLVATGAPLSLAREELGSSPAVSGEAIAAAAQRLDPKRAVVLVVGDSKAWLPALKTKYPSVEMTDAARLIAP
ncbi:pitrilysin family protein [Sphingomonas sp.]|uniref:M16 family metallopeptidase n=1 Tax=Sphingomonas sp. TaxID=28214 RepID=UPI0031E3F8E4